MKCPYCANELADAYLYTEGGRGVFLSPDPKPALPSFSGAKTMIEKNPGLVILAGPYHTVFDGLRTALPVKHCSRCKFFLCDYENLEK